MAKSPKEKPDPNRSMVLGMVKGSLEGLVEEGTFIKNTSWQGSTVLVRLTNGQTYVIDAEELHGS